MFKKHLGTISLMSLCFIVFLVQMFLGWDFSLSKVKIYNILFFNFAHADVYHTMGNMLFLAIIGSKVEESIGSLKTILSFLLIGGIAGYLSLIIGGYPATLGASIGIAGLMGIYPYTFKSKIVRFFVIPVIFFSFVNDLIGATSFLPAVNFIGHILGFVLGLLSITLISETEI